MTEQRQNNKGQDAQSRNVPEVTSRDRENLSWFWRSYLKAKAPLMALILLLLISQGFVSGLV